MAPIKILQQPNCGPTQRHKSCILLCSCLDMEVTKLLHSPAWSLHVHYHTYTLLAHS